MLKIILGAYGTVILIVVSAVLNEIRKERSRK